MPPRSPDSYARHRAKLHKRKRKHGVERSNPTPERRPARDPGDRYGHAQERRAVHVFGFVDAVVPEWWIAIRQSTKAEDSAGIDAWVTTDRGEVAVQVKSSLARAQIFLDEHPQWEGAVVVLSMQMSDEQVRRALVRAVEVVRVRIGSAKDTERRAA